MHPHPVVLAAVAVALLIFLATVLGPPRGRA